jgi:hypothetical protein
MHIEKNVFENIFNTVMDVKGKTKDNIKARLDVALFCNRKIWSWFVISHGSQNQEQASC